MAKSSGGGGRSGRARAALAGPQTAIGRLMGERVAARATSPAPRLMDIQSNLVFQSRNLSSVRVPGPGATKRQREAYEREINQRTGIVTAQFTIPR